VTINLFIQIFFTIFLILITLKGLYIILNGYQILGQAPINPGLFLLSKVCASIIMIYPFLMTLGLKNRYIINHHYLVLSSLCIYLLGMTLFLISLYNLNSLSLKIGLPQEKTRLQTNGLYRFSRNPIYLSLFITFIGAVLYTQNPLILGCFIITTCLHVKIIIQEEHFLEDQFGKEWLEYKKQVRRFF